MIFLRCNALQFTRHSQAPDRVCERRGCRGGRPRDIVTRGSTRPAAAPRDVRYPGTPQIRLLVAFCILDRLSRLGRGGGDDRSPRPLESHGVIAKCFTGQYLGSCSPSKLFINQGVHLIRTLKRIAEVPKEKDRL